MHKSHLYHQSDKDCKAKWKSCGIDNRPCSKLRDTSTHITVAIAESRKAASLQRRHFGFIQGENPKVKKFSIFRISQIFPAKFLSIYPKYFLRPLLVINTNFSKEKIFLEKIRWKMPPVSPYDVPASLSIAVKEPRPGSTNRQRNLPRNCHPLNKILNY